MLSSVLHSKKAIDALESRVDRHDADIGALIDSIREEVVPPELPRRRIGFHEGESSE